MAIRSKVMNPYKKQIHYLLSLQRALNMLPRPNGQMTPSIHPIPSITF